MKFFAILAIASATASCTASDAPPEQLSARTQSRLAEELRGYAAAGPPSNCVSQRDLRGNRSAGDAIIFEGRGDMIYVNRPAGGCPELGFNRALITRTTTTQLCRGDITTVFDTQSGIQFGGCGLGAFTPYRKTRG
jgi:hypothetical protein